MQTEKSRWNDPSLRWTCFLIVLMAGTAWATRGVLARAAAMKTSAATADSYYKLQPGTTAKVVLRLDEVARDTLTGTPLQRETDTLYRLAAQKPRQIVVDLAAETSVVMGKPPDIVPGAVVQVSGAIGPSHRLQATQVVILTGYVRVSSGAE
ncbi:MAG TPA: hypothetical protein VGD64_16490 [Acidisarcina sp.]